MLAHRSDIISDDFVHAQLKKYRRILIRLTTRRRAGTDTKFGDLMDGYRQLAHAQKLSLFEKESANQIWLIVNVQ